MRFEIRAKCRRGLRIIHEIPDLRLARIEGYNGLGKSSAVRLLELCTGGQPYLNQPALWSTFQDHLISASIRVTALNGAREITWELADPSTWPKVPEPLGDNIGKIKIDGKKATIEDVSKLLSVHRIDGKESFRDAVAIQASTAASLVSDRFGSSGILEDRRGGLDQALADVEDLLPRVSLPDLVATRRAIREASVQLTRAKEALHQASNVTELLEKAADLGKKLEEVRDRGPDLESRIGDLNGKIAECESRLQRLDSQIEIAATQEQKEQLARRELILAKRHLETRQEQREQAYRKLLNASTVARVETSAKGMALVKAELTETLESLSRRLPDIHASPFVARLLGRLAALLGEAEREGLTQQILIPLSSDSREWTVGDLREEFERGAAARTAEPASESAERLQAQIDEVKRRIRLVAIAAEARSRLLEAESRLAQAETRMSTATSELPEETARTVSDMLRSRRTVEEERRGFITRRDDAQQALNVLSGGLSERDLLTNFTTACREAGVSPSRVQGQLDVARSRLEERKANVAAISQVVDRETQTVASWTHGIVAAIQEIHERENLAWLRRAVASLLPAADAETDRQLEFIARLTEATEAARERLTTATQDLLGISAALTDLAVGIRGGRLEESEWTPAARQWMESQVDGWLSQPGVRDSLFKHGTNIGVDLSNMIVMWTDGETAERHSRPFEAFSSGEQAVAYTQARLSLLDDRANEIANRLVALDEFGAFVDAEKMLNLQEVLRHRYRTFPNDQVVLILPLSADKYQAAARGGDNGADRRDLEESGYLVEEIPVEP
jgi:hypothetical protein